MYMYETVFNTVTEVFYFGRCALSE